jgi:hypothetical protein
MTHLQWIRKLDVKWRFSRSDVSVTETFPYRMYSTAGCELPMHYRVDRDYILILCWGLVSRITSSQRLASRAHLVALLIFPANTVGMSD